MVSSARIFFAGVGTTFLILTAGFGGGVMLARSALHDQPTQTHAGSEPTPGVRVVHARSAEPPTQAPERTTLSSEILPQTEPVKEVQAAAEPQVEKKDPQKSARELRRERRRYAERKAKKMAVARARQQVEPQEEKEPGIMAFGGDVSRASFFRN